MFDILKQIDFSKSQSGEKSKLKEDFFTWVSKKYPEINTVTSPWFSDAIFIANNPSLRLDIVEVLDNDSFELYHSVLTDYFSKKLQDSNDGFKQNPDTQAAVYVEALKRFKCFLVETCGARQ